MKRFFLLIPIILLLCSCEGRKLLYFNDDKPDYATTASGQTVARAPLDVPPELRAEMELPGAETVASKADEKVLPKKYQQAVAGKAVALDARIYPLTPAEVFSAVVDAMTSLNIPVESVDSPSGIVTSDWIYQGANTSTLFASVMSGINGDISNAPAKYRFIVRVFRAKGVDKPMSKLEIRVMGQIYINNHWVNKPFKRKVSKELFAAVDEQLTRMQASVPPAEISK